jgi:hypothetical protein
VVQQIHLRTEGRENADLGAVVPSQGFRSMQMGETRILIGLLGMYFPQNWEFSSAVSKLRNFGGGLNPLTTLGPLLGLFVDLKFNKGKYMVPMTCA